MSKLISKLSDDRLKSFISDLPWYHTIEFPNGIVSKGMYNHKPYLKYYGFPKSLKDKSVLDVGSSDGFFSFEFERRGAKSVLAIDTNKFDGSVAIDPSPSKKIDYIKGYSKYDRLSKKNSEVLELLNMTGLNHLLIAKDLLSSKVEFKNLSVYNLDSLGKKFDFVFCGDLIEHLKNPLLALENLASITKESCIIALSSSLSNIGFRQTFQEKIRKLLFKFRLSSEITNPSRLLNYVGNISGGAFFHFHPQSFKEALYASGFRNVKIFSELIIPHSRHGAIHKNPHTIFHCSP